MVLVITLTAVAYTVLLERKVIGRMQNRWGPSRVGPFGLLQPLADGIKLFLKEDLTPLAVERPLFLARAAHRADLRADLHRRRPLRRGHIGPRRRHLPDRQRQHRPAGHPRHHLHRRLRHRALRLVVEQQIRSARLAARHLAGHQLRARARPLAGRRRAPRRSLNLRDIVDSQSAHGLLSWNIFGGLQFVAFFIYLMAAYAETNRSPFDLPEAESELIAGYHTEYSSMKFAMFFMAEYANMITVSCVATLLFFGGASSPFGHLFRQRSAARFFNAILPILWFVAQDLRLPLPLHLGPLHAAPLPLRPAHELRLEVPSARRHGQHRHHQPGPRAARLTTSHDRGQLLYNQQTPKSLLVLFRHFSSLIFKKDSTDLMQLALFLIFGVLAVAGALNLLLQRHPINSALSLVVVMMSLAVLYWSLGAEFLAAAQVIVYSGAIMVLFVFVIMLLNAGEEERTTAAACLHRRLPRSRRDLLPAQLRLPLGAQRPSALRTSAAISNHAISNISEISSVLFTKLLLPFEVTSVLILVAILGAVVLARKEQ